MVIFDMQYICYDKDMNMYDYCKWRGDITFDKDPFNYVDNIIFSSKHRNWSK